DKNIYEFMQSNLQVVIDTHLILHTPQIEGSLKEQIVKMQSDALQKIVNKDKKVISYLLREYANNIHDRNLEWNSQPREGRKAIDRALKARHDALEAAIQSIGLAAIPSLSDLQARSVRHQASLLEKPLKN